MQNSKKKKKEKKQWIIEERQYKGKLENKWEIIMNKIFRIKNFFLFLL